MGTQPCPRVSHRLAEGRRRLNAPVGEIISPRHPLLIYNYYYIGLLYYRYSILAKAISRPGLDLSSGIYQDLAKCAYPKKRSYPLIGISSNVSVKILSGNFGNI